ncbi:mitochondrial inner membrane protease atp23 [Coniosporium apollinis CBS 100218]|uniref:Mitochondrial inner membrane protease ATP23 n=1 Tax=Coniosporium apollinis (strain CBS 100218) TaxID=1168221 RepID=R7YWA5_CONA1|nr:mitochondrial inner membrane protease atp23 [Coniosporium apollinis CBS 100218]EON66182.1 mitochondrial inner membrane protease atp23 [Coniosporium apollinis CBS 100218]
MADTTLPETTTSNPSDSAAPQPDKSFYTWSTWFSILSGQATPADRDRYLNARDTIKEAADCARCAKHRDYLLQYSPVVRFLREQINELGQDINSENVRCKRCTTRQSGGFDSEYGILLCANQLRNRGHVEDTMAHEMVHAWDHLRFKVERGNLRHAACTEIRASTLSGECRFGREFWTRGQWKLTQQLQECVRRRATLSVMNRPGCKDDVHAARIVNEVWDSCFNDTRPFDEIYR